MEIKQSYLYIGKYLWYDFPGLEGISGDQRNGMGPQGDKSPPTVGDIPTFAALNTDLYDLENSKYFFENITVHLPRTREWRPLTVFSLLEIIQCINKRFKHLRGDLEF